MRFPLFVFVQLLIAMLSSCYAGQHKREETMAGEIMNASNPENMEKAWKAAKTLNEDAANAEGNLMIPIKILKAQSQVVAGLKNLFEVLYGESTCKRREVDPSLVTAANCQLKENGNRAEKAGENFELYTVMKIRDVAAGEQL
ncbi:unnamed protein product [Strongylus vulgaris]|uniref:Cystatin domain-containing protein n=1 Tax=Strongylus vulgaris TaxID=40348 RepID=A0A3P7LPJ7_STRVU|nr:unnamed protein product [Strongylus vulgaris]